MTIPTLILDPAFDCNQKIEIPRITTKLGDGYSQDAVRESRSSWSVQAYYDSKVKLNETLNQLESFAATVFYWQPSSEFERDVFYCESWKITPLSPELDMIEAEFKSADFNDVFLSAIDTDPEFKTLLKTWKTAGYRDGKPLPNFYEWEVEADDSSLWGSNAISANTSTNQGVKLQNIINSIEILYPDRNYDRLVKLLLPIGFITVTSQVFLSTSFVTLAGRGSDPNNNGTTINFIPDLNTRYDIDLSNSGTVDADDFDLSGMTNGVANLNFTHPGRGCFKIQPIKIHSSYTSAFTSAPTNRKDIYYGTVNNPEKVGIIVRTSSPYAALKGDTKLPLASPALGVSVGTYIIVYAVNQRSFYNYAKTTDTNNHRANPIIRSQIHRVTEIDDATNTLTLDTPLEFNVPGNQQADGDTVLTGTVDSNYFSSVVPLQPVFGVGITDLYIQQPMNDVPKVGGGTYNLDPYQTVNNYTNLAPEYALHGIVLKWTVNCWVKNIQTYMVGSHAIATEFTYGSQIEDCLCNGSWNKGNGGNGYIRLARSTKSLVQRNRIRNLRHFTLQWSSTGNVIRINDIDCDFNLHGGWERNNLIEQNTAYVPYEHQYGTESLSDPSAGQKVYPLWWSSGIHAGKWATATGFRNYFFNNSFAKQNLQFGNYDLFYPYHVKKLLYCFGGNDTPFGKVWTHLAINVSPISSLNGRMNIEFYTAPNSGVTNQIELPFQSLYGFAKTVSSPANTLTEYPTSDSYKPYDDDNLALLISGIDSTYDIDAGTITDLSGNNVSVITTEKPTLGTLNSKPVFNFNGNSSITIAANAFNALVNTHFLVFKTDNTTTVEQRILEIKHSGTDATYTIVLATDKSPASGTPYNRLQLTSYIDDSDFNTILTPIDEPPNGEWVVLCFSIDYTNELSTLWVNGFTEQTKPLYQMEESLTSVTLGKKTEDDTLYFKGQIAEFISYNGLLTNSQKYDLMQYLKTKYSL